MFSFASRQAKTQGLCCDDHESISGLTGNFPINFTDAFKYLNNEPLGDAGSKFMLWQSCPVTCGTCIINCESNALVTYTGKVAGTYSMKVLINGHGFENLKDAVIVPGPIDRRSVLLLVGTLQTKILSLQNRPPWKKQLESRGVV